MFCYQCQETLNNVGCTKNGVCGKKEETAIAQDLLIWATKELSAVTTVLRKENKPVPVEADRQVSLNMFKTITNANFREDDIMADVTKTLDLRERLAKENGLEAKALSLPENVVEEVGVLSEENEDLRSLKELITYGLKGLSAYLKHANVLGCDDEEINGFLQETMGTLLRKDLTLDELLALTLKTGEFGYKAMELLDSANTGAYGNPEISKVSIEPGDRPGILISGHDLKDLEMLLEQTEGTGIDVYTHSEMLPGNYYPAFKKYEHLRGNYGNAWWKQKEEFAAFNGPILMTTNCIVPPRKDAQYQERMFTTGAAGFPGCKHIESDENGHKDFSEIIEIAKGCKAPEVIERGEIIGGFAHNQVLSLADTIVEKVKDGSIKGFVVMGGCDGRQNGRSYYTEFAKALPKDQIILTAGCAKYRYNKLNLGDIDGIPRVLDAGQCNDSYSLVRIALALQEVFGLESVNDLPIVYNIAWYEQKAVIVLLALLALGVKKIHLGPTLPAFLSPNVVNVLVENFQLAPNGEVDEDIASFFGETA